MQDWLYLAKCRDPQYDPEWWFSEDYYDKKEAKRVCETCKVTEKCLNYAIINRIPYGIWGGKNGPVRAHIRRGPEGKSMAKPIIIDDRSHKSVSKGSKVWFYDEEKRKTGTIG